MQGEHNRLFADEDPCWNALSELLSSHATRLSLILPTFLSMFAFTLMVLFCSERPKVIGPDVSWVHDQVGPSF